MLDHDFATDIGLAAAVVRGAAVTYNTIDVLQRHLSTCWSKQCKSAAV